ncbi:MAG: hypothetical protein K9N51_11565 [Candidatus Pacebacteria bacterium]|nr:hypothetical protein [Candidatus Paceibacterota bacterium]
MSRLTIRAPAAAEYRDPETKGWRMGLLVSIGRKNGRMLVFGPVRLRQIPLRDIRSTWRPRGGLAHARVTMEHAARQNYGGSLKLAPKNVRTAFQELRQHTSRKEG